MSKLKITVEFSYPEIIFLWGQLNMRLQEQKNYLRNHQDSENLTEYLTRIQVTQKMLDKLDIIKTNAAECLASIETNHTIEVVS